METIPEEAVEDDEFGEGDQGVAQYDGINEDDFDVNSTKEEQIRRSLLSSQSNGMGMQDNKRGQLELQRGGGASRES